MLAGGGLSLVFFVLAFVDKTRAWNNFKGWSSFFIVCISVLLLLYSFLNLTFYSIGENPPTMPYLLEKYNLVEYKNYQKVDQYINNQLIKIVRGEKTKEEIISEMRERNIYPAVIEEYISALLLPIERMGQGDKEKTLRLMEETSPEMSFEKWKKITGRSGKNKINNKKDCLFGVLGIIFLILAFVDRPNMWAGIKDFIKIFNKNEVNNEVGKEKKPEEVMPDTNSGKIKYLSKKYQVERFIVQDIFDNWKEEKGILQDDQRVKFFVQYNWVEIEQRVINYKKSLPEEKQEYGKEKLETTIFKEKAEQAKYQVDMAEAEEAIAKIKKRTSALFEKPKKKMSVGEKLREELREEQEILQVGEEEKRGMPPEQQDRIDAFIYQQIEKIRKRG